MPRHRWSSAAPDCGTDSAPGMLRAGSTTAGPASLSATRRGCLPQGGRAHGAPDRKGAQPPPSVMPLTSTLCSSIASGSRRGPRRPSESVSALSGAGPRSPGQLRSPQQAPTTVPPPRPIPSGSPPATPHFAIFFLSARQPWGGEGRASGSRNAFLPPQQLACVRVGALAHVTPARACENRRGARPGRNRRHREFANTNGNQGS